MLIDVLSDPIWQGIGVIVTIAIAFISFIARKKKIHSKPVIDPESVVKLPITVEKELLEGQLVRLRGKVWREMFPGPPNYESIDDGDEPQAYWVLNIEDPIEILGKTIEKDEPYSMGRSNRFQLKLHQDFYKNRQHTVFSDAWVEGTVMIGHTGHHKTKALIDVRKLEPL